MTEDEVASMSTDTTGRLLLQDRWQDSTQQGWARAGQRACQWAGKAVAAMPWLFRARQEQKGNHRVVQLTPVL